MLTIQLNTGLAILGVRFVCRTRKLQHVLNVSGLSTEKLEDLIRMTERGVLQGLPLYFIAFQLEHRLEANRKNWTGFYFKLFTAKCGGGGRMCVGPLVNSR